MNLIKALRLESATSGLHRVISLAGAGGKTTLMFKLGKEFIQSGLPQAILTATSHLGSWQIPSADHHVIADQTTVEQQFARLKGTILITGQIQDERSLPVGDKLLSILREWSKSKGVPLIIEADGSRNRSLKAPAEHEPPIPAFSDEVIYLAGLSAWGHPLNSQFVHRPEAVSSICGLPMDSDISSNVFVRLFTDPRGGKKNIPPAARRTAFLNQADTDVLQSAGGEIANNLLRDFDSAVVGSLHQDQFLTFENVAGIVLAAGESRRFGSPKQLLDWKGKPFIRHIAETGLQAGLKPMIIVSGDHAIELSETLTNLEVQIVHNDEYRLGQATSIRKGVETLPASTGAAVFLLADQPQIPAALLKALIDVHARNLSRVLVPLVQSDRRGNPVLFDRAVFPDLLNLKGDTGGRGLFEKHPVDYLPWHDETILMDVDSPADYQKLIESQ